MSDHPTLPFGEPDEEWRPVIGWEGSYQVSNLGRVKSLARKHVPRERMLRTTLNAQGYLKVMLAITGARGKNRVVHQLVAEAFIGPRPDGPEGAEIRHLDGDHFNNVPGNLRYGSHGENQADSVRHGTHNMGRVTHCPKGHEYTEDNIMWADRVNRRGRSCRRCRNAQCLEYYYKRKAAKKSEAA